jgi:photosystem II stability/assembly factor-like uncharacterized protein
MRASHLLAVSVTFTALTGGLAGAAPAPTPPSIDDLIAKNLAAHGGDAKLAAVFDGLRLTGKVVFGGGDFSVDAQWGVLLSRDRMRTEATLQGLTQIYTFDGKTGWKVDPFQGRREAERLSADEARSIVRQATIVAPLYDLRGKGDRAELVGTEDVDGTQAFELRVTRHDGDIQYVDLDPDSYLALRVRTISKVRGVEEVNEADLGAYEQVGGVWLPLSIDVGDPGGPRNVKITITRAEAGVTSDDAVFGQPAGMQRLVVAGPATANVAAATPPLPERPPVLDAGTISGVGVRNIGSATMSGRISAVAGMVETHGAAGATTTLFVGAASGGVWRSRDGGTTFKPVFDRMPVQSIGAIAIDPTSSGKTIWVGTGEAWTRNSVSIGDGIYKSTDGGETWNNVGLPDSERIVRILVHPTNGNVVYACVPGKLWSDSTDRGVYKTTDGGKTWSNILPATNASTGCSGLAMDPRNPDVLIAGTWDFRRKGWTFRSGGDGPEAASASAMYRTADGGKSWRAISHNTGLPGGPWGRVEVEMAPSSPNVVYALIESKASSLYRSDDGGVTWTAKDHSQHMVWRPFYFARLVIDPVNPNRVFKPDLTLIVSEDGGASFAATGGGSHGDWHDLWIDPTNPKHVIGGDDGGLWLSYDGGSRWWKANNLPVSQFYHVSVDDKDPYNVYGGLQDNSSWVGPSAYPGGITNGRWENLYGGDGFWALPDPTDPDAIYAESQGGYIGRVDRRSLATRDIQPKPGMHEKLRFNWNSPIATSPTRKGTIYLGSQFLFRSRDRGDTWDRISPDLTTNDPAKQKQEESGGVTVDNSSAEMHTTIYAISESPKASGTIWVGTDDGNLQLTRDDGKHWTNVVGNVPGLPSSSWVSWVEASRWDPATAYAAFDRHTFGDMAPWVFRTTDYGKTWTRIVSPDQGVRGYAHVIKEDTVSKSLLFVGTEMGLWISTDSGASWAQFKGGNFPAVAVREMQVQPRDGDLVIATHGRGIWIIDDLSPLRALTPEVMQKAAVFLPERPTQQRMPASGGWSEGDASYAGDNPAGGATIAYYLRGRHLYGPLKLEVFDAAGKLVDELSAPKRRGINRVVWAMQVKPPRVPRAASVAFGSTQGPRVVPGTYTVRLTRGSEKIETKLVIGVDRRAPYTAADRKQQYDAVMKAHALFGDMTDLADKIDGTRAAVGELIGKLPASDALGGKLRALQAKLDGVKKEIVATTEGGAITGEERIREHLDTAYGALNRWEGKPAKYQVDAVATLRKELDEVGKTFASLVTSDVRGLDGELKAHGLAPIPVAAREENPLDDEAVVDCVESAGRECGRENATATERD